MATKSETNFIGAKNHVARRQSLSRRRIVPVTLPLHIRALGQCSHVLRHPTASTAILRLHMMSEMKSWLPGKKRGGAREGSERKQLRRRMKNSIHLREV